MIDLHTHTCCSDGADSVETLLRRAEEQKLSVLSITDHNTVAAYRGRGILEYSGTLIPGVEITCMYQGEVVEVLGYGYRLEDMEAELSRHVLTFEEKQKREFELICAAFRRAGAVFDPAEISFDPTKESSRKAFLRHLNQFPENRRFFSSDETWQSSKAFTREEIYNPDSRFSFNFFTLDDHAIMQWTTHRGGDDPPQRRDRVSRPPVHLRPRAGIPEAALGDRPGIRPGRRGVRPLRVFGGTDTGFKRFLPGARPVAKRRQRLPRQPQAGRESGDRARAAGSYGRISGRVAGENAQGI